MSEGTAARQALRGTVVFALVTAAYVLTFSEDSGDALDTARWIQQGEIGRMVEFRHLIVRLLPYWLWQGLRAAGLHTDALNLLRWWDFAAAALSAMLFYRVLHRIAGWRPVAFAGTFLYATTHCVWVYAGSGRLYSNSMLFVLAAYDLALRLPDVQRQGLRWLIIAASGVLVCFGGLFWLVQVFNAVGVGLLIALLPERESWGRRAAHLLVFALAGILVAGGIGVSCLRYAEIPLDGPSIQAWIAGTRTPPTKLNFSSIMKAAYGQAHGVLGLPNLSYMINGLIWRDPDLLAIGSLPWQLGKFVFVWLLLTLAYVYPLFLLWKGDRQLRILILALLAPLAINMYFALIWLGTDRQRFMPSLLSLIGLGGASAIHWMKRARRPRWIGVFLCASIAFIAMVNYFEILRPSQQKFTRLAAEWSAVRGHLSEKDLLLNFGRDVDFQPVMLYYGGAPFLTLTNDVTFYDWDQPDWQARFRAAIQTAWERGGRAYAMDRIVFGRKPVSAAWTERQHPRPTVREMAAFVQSTFCVTPAFQAGEFEYFELSPPRQPCPARSLGPLPAADTGAMTIALPRADASSGKRR